MAKVVDLDARKRAEKILAEAPEIGRDEVVPPTKYSDISLSHLFAAQYGRDLRYADPLKRWFHYIEPEGRWTEDEKLGIYTACKKFLTLIAIEARAEAEQAVMLSDGDKAKARKAGRAIANALTSATKVHAVLDLARDELAITLDVFDRDHWLLNTPAGVVELKTGAMRPAVREDYFTKITRVAPAKMPTPLYDKFAREIMGACVPVDLCACAACVKSVGRSPKVRQKLHDAEVARLVRYLDELDAYCLSGDVSLHMLILEIGEGGNGKSLHNDLLSLDILGRIPPGYAAEIPVEALLASRNDRHPTDLMCLFRSRLALARESEDRSWNAGLVKRLSGGDAITARKMRQDFVSFDPTHKLVVFGQRKPALYGSDELAWKRRLHLLPFPQKWGNPADLARNVLLADSELRTKLAAEAPGLLHRLIVAGVKRLKRGRAIVKPATVAEASVTYLADQDDLGVWARDNFELKADGFVETTRASDAWREWCRTHGRRPGRPSEFPEEVVKRFNDPSVRCDRPNREKGGRGIRGIAWRVKEANPQDEARAGEWRDGDEF